MYFANMYFSYNKLNQSPRIFRKLTGLCTEFAAILNLVHNDFDAAFQIEEESLR